MSEWWTYTLSDFLLFSAKSYDRLLELYNRAIWPAQIVAMALGLTIWMILRRSFKSKGRFIAAVLAGSWFWIALAFHAERYAKINWAAVDFAGGFALEGALLVGLAIVRREPAYEPPPWMRRLGLGMFLFGLWAQPLVGWVLGRPWRQAETFGTAPDPTAVATLGVLLLGSGRGYRAAAVIPVLWCGISGATLLALKRPVESMMPFTAALVAGIAFCRR
jgi:hypothetical protein